VAEPLQPAVVGINMRPVSRLIAERRRRSASAAALRRTAAVAIMLLAGCLLLMSPVARGDMAGALKALAGGNFAEAVDQLQPLAESGDVAAQLALGQILRNRANPQRAPEEAFKWFSVAAEQNNPDAKFWLGLMHLRGESVPRDPEQAMTLWRTAAEDGSALAQGALARALFVGSEGIPKDADEAVRWARMGAERGNALAQSVLAQAYLKGEGGLQRNLAAFLRWTRRAANQGSPTSMTALAIAYHTGTGVPQDFVQAHVWANLAAARGSTRAVKLRDELAAKMTSEQLAEAQKAARRWRPRTTPASTQRDASGKRRAATGSGFIVASPGYVLTNKHVIEQCTEIRSPAHKAVLRLVARDDKHDLALLEGDLTASEVARFRAASAPRLGEPVIVAGYPLSDLLASSINVTSGTVSALAGPRNNEALFQITAPIQRGNSGGPVLDSHGEVIGVVVSKLNALRVAMVTGDVPQNVNFAISGALARAFVESNGIELPEANPAAEIGMQLAPPEQARQFTVLIECWR